MNYLNPSHIIYIRYARANSTSQPAAQSPAALPMAKVRINESNAKEKRRNFFVLLCRVGVPKTKVKGTNKRGECKTKERFLLFCMLERISHDVFLGTLSRVINSFITRDKALRGTLCNSTNNMTSQQVEHPVTASSGKCDRMCGSYDYKSCRRGNTSLPSEQHELSASASRRYSLKLLSFPREKYGRIWCMTHFFIILHVGNIFI